MPVSLTAPVMGKCRELILDTTVGICANPVWPIPQQQIKGDRFIIAILLNGRNMYLPNRQPLLV